MSYRFFKMVKTAPEISPYFVFKLLCSLNIFSNLKQLDYLQAAEEELSKNNPETYEILKNKQKSLLTTGINKIDRAIAFGWALLPFYATTRMLLPSLQMISENYKEYERAARVLEKYGYNRRLTNYFLDSSCGRQQLRFACQEKNYMAEFAAHIQEAKVRRHHISWSTIHVKEEIIRWHHIDRSHNLSKKFMKEFVFILTVTTANHLLINKLHRDLDELIAKTYPSEANKDNELDLENYGSPSFTL